MQFQGKTVKVIDANYPDHEFEIGDALTNGKGAFATLRGVSRLPGGNSTGKILVRYSGRNWDEERYPSVFGLMLVVEK